MTSKGWREQFDKKADDFNSGMTLGKYEKKRWKDFIQSTLNSQLNELEKKIRELEMQHNYGLKHRHGFENCKHQVLALIESLKQKV